MGAVHTTHQSMVGSTTTAFEDLPLNGQHVVIVGAGPSGALAAVFLARRGFTVDVFERREDPTVVASHDKPANVHGYPMVLSSRAVAPLVELGLDLPAARPWEAAYLGGMDLISGRMMPASEDPHSPLLRAVMTSREAIAKDLVHAARKRHPERITWHFGAAVSSLDVAKRTLTVGGAAGKGASASTSNGGGGRAVSYDLLVAADGANSRIRDALRAQLPGSFRVTDVLTATATYKTFRCMPALPPGDGSGHFSKLADHEPFRHIYMLMSATARLTIWMDDKRDVHGMINTVTSWETESLRAELEKNAAVLPAAWREAIVQQVAKQEPSLFGRIVQCHQFHAPRVVLLGDAAHPVTSAMGQGGTCAMESVCVFDRVVEECQGDLDRVPAAFTSARRRDAHALQDLEFMLVNRLTRSLTFGSRWYELKARFARLVIAAAMKVSAWMHKLFPKTFKSPMYHFTALRDRRTSYSHVLFIVRLQAAAMGAGIAAGTGLAIATAVWALKTLAVI